MSVRHYFFYNRVLTSQLVHLQPVGLSCSSYSNISLRQLHLPSSRSICNEYIPLHKPQQPLRLPFIIHSKSMSPSPSTLIQSKSLFPSSHMTLVAIDPSSVPPSNASPPPKDKDSCDLEGLKKARTTLETNLPHFFRGYFFIRYHHPGYYHPRVVMEYEFKNEPRRTQGVMGVMLHLCLIKLYYRVMTSWCKLTLTSVFINEADSSIEMGVRVNSIRGGYRLSSNVKKTDLEAMEKELMTVASWRDFRIIFRITNQGVIKHIKITQLPPTIGSGAADKMETWVDMLWNRIRGRTVAPVS